MGYHFYNPHENKVYVARHAELFKNSLKFTRSEWESHFAKSEWEYCSGEDYKLEDHGEPANDRRCIIRSWIMNDSKTMNEEILFKRR
ncbi:hypothetical protein Tco_0847253 [Tanacetum coccineum]